MGKGNAVADSAASGHATLCVRESAMGNRGGGSVLYTCFTLIALRCGVFLFSFVFFSPPSFERLHDALKVTAAEVLESLLVVVVVVVVVLVLV